MSILVYTENWDGKFKKLSFELISYANNLAKKMNTQVVALSIGDVAADELNKLGKYGATKVLTFNDDRLKSLINQPYASVIAQAAEKEGANVVLISHNFTGKALAPRVAVKLKAGTISAVIAQPESVEPFIVVKKVFTGKAFAKVCIKSAIKVLTLAQNSVDIVEDSKTPAIETFSAVIKDSEFKMKVVDVHKVTGKVLLSDAEVVVSGGRGMKGPENWKPIEELADLLGGATACSRPVSDEDWRPHEEHVGQTGKIIAPNLYFALGISGAIQHIAGVSSSKVIVAINTDKDAPVFESANYGIVGDVHKVLPKLIEAFKEAKSK